MKSNPYAYQNNNGIVLISTELRLGDNIIIKYSYWSAIKLSAHTLLSNMVLFAGSMIFPVRWGLPRFVLPYSEVIKVN